MVAKLRNLRLPLGEEGGLVDLEAISRSTNRILERGTAGLEVEWLFQEEGKELNLASWFS
jgi:hypothetical protein